MAHKKKNDKEKNSIAYTIEDAMKIADDILKISREKEYNVGAFAHGLIFTLEFIQQMYGIPQQQIANVRRDCRKFLQNTTKI